MTKKEEQMEYFKERKVEHFAEYASSFLSESDEKVDSILMPVSLSTMDQAYGSD